MKTILKDRILWWDGTTEVDNSKIASLLLHGIHPSKILAKQEDQELLQYNQLSDDDEVIKISKDQNSPFDFSWNIPQHYTDLNLSKFVLDRAELRGASYIKRAKEELEEIRKMELEMIFKMLIFVVDELKKNQQVWGVGRGSSCASLVLHLIGIHEVDPIKYNIPKEEFFHE